MTNPEIEELKSEIAGVEEELNEKKARLETVEAGDNDEDFDDMLDDCYPVVKICSFSYNPSQVLKAVDEIAYNCGLVDFNDSEISELEVEIKELEETLKPLKEKLKQLQDVLSLECEKNE